MARRIAILVGISCCAIAVAPAAASPAAASATGPGPLAFHPVGYVALVLFALAYGLVLLEERLHLRKSIPVLIAAAVLWILVAAGLAAQGDTTTATRDLRHYLLEYAELLLFLLAAMTYVNAMDERGVFLRFQRWLVERRFTMRQTFWITGVLAFFLSPVADNLTTALVLGAVVLAIGKDRQFITLACVNVVVAANAGGAFSPFGDITTLMVWQKGMVEFTEFFAIFLPSLVNWLVPAAIMSFWVEREVPEPGQSTPVELRPGAGVIIVLFLVTISLTVVLHSLLHVPPAVGMMSGLALLKLYGHFLRRFEARNPVALREDVDEDASTRPSEPFDVFRQFERLEWDTLLFFYGIILCVGALQTIGYLALASTALYGTLGPTLANVSIGALSAILDNIPLMYAVLSVHPDMSHAQWLLVTLTAGVGGSLLSIGSAAGVALMGLARGAYTFRSHLSWTWVIVIGYVLSILVHLALNGV